MATAIPIVIIVVTMAGVVTALVRCSWLHALLWMGGGLGVLAATSLVVSVYDPWQCNKPIMDQTKGRMNQIAMALLMYADDNNGELPPTLGTIFSYYVGGDGGCYLVACSRTPRPQSGQEVDEGQCDLLYFGAGKRIEELGKDEPLVTTKPILAKKAKYACVLYADGVAKLYKPVPESIKAWWQQYPEGRQSP